MRDAAGAFVGMRDFRSFAAADARDDGEPPPSTLVLVDRLEIIDDGDLLLVSIQGSHFLWKMVRRMVGVLVEIGRGGMPPDAIRIMLAEGSSAPARLTAPPSGLFLERVYYEGDRQGEPPRAATPLASRPWTRALTRVGSDLPRGASIDARAQDEPDDLVVARRSRRHAIRFQIRVVDSPAGRRYARVDLARVAIADRAQIRPRSGRERVRQCGASRPRTAPASSL